MTAVVDPSQTPGVAVVVVVVVAAAAAAAMRTSRPFGRNVASGL